MSVYRHPDWLALLAAVAASPDDDLPRLVAADWLEEHGEADRAEFIRLEIAKASTGLTDCPVEPPPRRSRYGCGECGYCRLDAACERWHETPELWTAVCGPLPFGYSHTSRCPSHFDRATGWPQLYTARGFVDSIDFPTVPVFLAAAPTLLRTVPTVRRVGIADREPVASLNVYAEPVSWVWATDEAEFDGRVWLSDICTPADQQWLPAWLWLLLPGDPVMESDYVATSVEKRYPTREHAIAALASGLLCCCRNPPADIPAQLPAQSSDAVRL